MPSTRLLPCGLSRFLGRAYRLAVVLAWGSLAGALCPPVADAAQLTLTWVDGSGGQAAFNIERKTGSSGTYARIAQQEAGSVSYIDTTVASGTMYCYRVQAFDGAATSGYSNEACGSPAAATELSVTVAKAGTGTGTVTSSPAGIACGTDCSESFPSGAVVTLTPAAATGSTFSGWSNGCTGIIPCILTGNIPVLVTANFATAVSQTWTLKIGFYSRGTVIGEPGGISCTSACSASYASGTVVTLTAVPANGKQFLRWTGGGCKGAGACTVTLKSNVSVRAWFSR